MPARLAQHLVTRGLLSAQTIEDAQRRRATYGGALDTVLLEMGAIAEAGMLQALADVSGLKPVNLADFEPNQDMARFIPANVAERLGAVPLSVDGGVLHVATCYPPSQRELEEVAVLLGKQLEPWIAVETRVRDWISAVYGSALQPRHRLLVQSLDPTRSPEAPIRLTAPIRSSQAAVTQPAQPAVARPNVASRASEPSVASGPSVNVSETTLEDALTREMVEQIARAVAEEPILLEVRKKKPATPEPRPGQRLLPEPDDEPTLPEVERTQRADIRELEKRAAQTQRPPEPVKTDETRDETRKIDLSQYAHLLGADPALEQTRTFDLSRLAAQMTPATQPPEAPARPRQPQTWDRDATVSIDLRKYARESALVEEPPRASEPTAAAPLPTIAPVVAPEPILEPAPSRWTIAPPAAQTEAVPAAPSRPMSPAGFPGVVVFPNPKPATAEVLAEPVVQRPPAPRAIPAGAGAEWTLQEARAALKEATVDRDRIIQVALSFARRTFDFVAAFAIMHGTATGWAAEGDGAPAFAQAPPTIPLDSASVFRTVTMTRGSYVGPVPADAHTSRYLQLLGRAPRTIFLFPVEVKERLICVIYGDPGSRPISQRKLSDLLLFCQDLPAAFQELILFRKQKFGASQKTALSLEEVVPQPVASSMGWSAASAPGSSGMGRAASAQMFIEDPGKIPSDFSPILRKLTGPDAAARSAAMAELARSPDASAKVLTGNFPGPTAWSRLPVNELPDADELGPIPAALSRLGRSAAQAIAPLLDDDDPDVRYFALLTAGNLPFPELVGGVLRGIFDFEPDISSAARAAAAALRKVPRFRDAMKDLRQELAASDTIRRSLAARALGVLHDREAVDGLINLTGSDDELCAQAAAEALREITRASFGPDMRSWTAWWAENRTRSRGEWLVAALRHPELDVRLSAIEELSRVGNDNYGYFADANPRDREGAIKKWEAALTHNPRLKRVE